MQQWNWQQNSVLHRVSRYAPPKEIFQAVCDEIGRYYTEQGVKYTRSNRKLKKQWQGLQCEIGLWSSASNLAGQWVCLEAVCAFCAKQKEATERGGFLDLNLRPTTWNVYGLNRQTFFEIIAYIDSVFEIGQKLQTPKGWECFLKDKPPHIAQTIIQQHNMKVYCEWLKRKAL